MPRFFIDQKDIFDNYIIISGEDFNHIKNVLRLNCGDRITICDGKGNDYISVIQNIETKNIFADIVEVQKNRNEAPINVTLYQGIPKSDKMDFIIQKSVELGVGKIVPVITERTVVRLNDKKDIDNKVRRWQRISLEAAKQCNRGIVPVIDTPVKFSAALVQNKEFDLSLIPYEKEVCKGLKGSIKKSNISNIAVLIGPEGGFSENEIEAAVLEGINPVTLGPRILRTETAGIAVLSILMYELGDVGI